MTTKVAEPTYYEVLTLQITQTKQRIADLKENLKACEELLHKAEEEYRWYELHEGARRGRRVAKKKESLQEKE